MSSPFVPSEASDLPTVDELMEENPVDQEAVDVARQEWEGDPPDEEFKNILFSEQDDSEDEEEAD